MTATAIEQGGADAANDLEYDEIVRQVLRRDIMLVEASNWFDPVWYMEVYPDVRAAAMQAAEHYVVHGWHENRDPGPYFSTAWYRENNRDVAELSLNPLVHYLVYGQAEGCRPNADDARPPARDHAVRNAPRRSPAASTDPSAAQVPVSVAPASPVASGAPPAPRIEIAPFAATVTVGDIRLGHARWAHPGPAFIPSLLAFARMHGWDESSAIEIRDADSGDRMSGVLPTLDLHRWQMLPEIAGVGARIADLWFATTTMVRIRIDAVGTTSFDAPVMLQFHQADGDALVACGADTLAGDAPAIIDVAMVNPYAPVLMTVVDAAGSIVDALLVPFPSLLRGGVHHGEVVAHGERGSRMADLAALSEGYLQELLGWGDRVQPLSLAAIDVDLGVATGAERIFSDTLRSWLATVLTIAVEPRADARAGGAERHLVESLALPQDLGPAVTQAIVERGRLGGSRLVIPADAVPTIAALVSRRIAPPRGPATSMSYIIADPVTAAPFLSVSLPPLDSLADIQPVNLLPFPMLAATGVGVSARAEDAAAFAMPAAIRFADKHSDLPRSLYPYAADALGSPLADPPAAPEWDAVTISVLIAPTDAPEALTALLVSLANQSAVAALDVTIVLGPGHAEAHEALDRVVQALFPERGRILLSSFERPSKRLNEAAASASGKHFLVIDQAMLLHDVRTVATLFAIAGGADVASVGCAQVRDGGGSGAPTVAAGCYFPTRVALTLKPGIVYEEPVTSGIFVEATLPVLANSFRAILIAADAWRLVGGIDADRFPVGGYELDFALKAARDGLRHLNTTAVTVTDRARRGGAWSRDPVGINFLPAQRWQDIVGTVALIRELR